MFDAPPGYAAKLPGIIQQHAPGKEVKTRFLAEAIRANTRRHGE